MKSHTFAKNNYRVVRKLNPGDGGLDLQHLRRFAKPSDVPENVRNAIIAARDSSHEDNDAKELLLVVGSVSSISKEALIEAMSPEHTPSSLIIVPVPLLAPSSQERATRWSNAYWPTVYKKSNPFGPHPSLFSKAEEEFQDEVPKWLALAAAVAQSTKAEGSGEEVGVVVVRRHDGIAEPVALAGDMRWLNWPRSTPGNPTAHAALRAIAMVANGLRQREEDPEAVRNESSANIFVDLPQGEIEQCDTAADPNGYLCHELELYCTHEPCVMCSMAIVHSRFGRVVFKRQMPRTGGLCADGELGHGLFWRKELNWTLLAWKWETETDETATSIEIEDLQA